jgi:hypothetical protein
MMISGSKLILKLYHILPNLQASVVHLVEQGYVLETLNDTVVGWNLIWERMDHEDSILWRR